MENTMNNTDLNTVEFLDGILSRKNFKSAEERKAAIETWLTDVLKNEFFTVGQKSKAMEYAEALKERANKKEI